MEDGSFLLMLTFSLLVMLAARGLFVRQVISVLMVSVRKPRIVTFVFALLLLPGVFVHEVAHWLCAKCLFVPTQGISLRPQLTERGTIRLGYVRVADGGALRNALIGFAPFVSGTFLISWIALRKLQLGALHQGFTQLDAALCMDAFRNTLGVPHSAIWLYILLAVATTMLPSASDRKAWIPAGLVILCLLVLIWSVWGNPFSPDWFVILNQVLNSISIAFLLVAGLQVVLSIPLWSAHRLIARWLRV